MHERSMHLKIDLATYDRDELCIIWKNIFKQVQDPLKFNQIQSMLETVRIRQKGVHLDSSGKAKLPEPDMPKSYTVNLPFHNQPYAYFIKVALMKLSDDKSDSDDYLSVSDVLDDTFENVNHPMPNINPRQDDESYSDDDL
ncbi:6871_t:CDS:2 [Gigaspora margarita]|uniref:6871_t:CDS:1 n=1 Tax=Gigaspora margarita TaxID=4874 RepID=A0ABN7UU53_GIGMA|nr:6871_t:CDS:2 [Gigaspora margarita]